MSDGERDARASGGQSRVPPPHIGEEVNVLPIQVAVVVPSTTGQSVVRKDEWEDRIEATKTWMSNRFGGDTTVRGSGDYVGEDGLLIEEPVAIVEAGMSMDTYVEEHEAFADFIERKREEWEQDTVMYRVEDRIFIYPERSYIDDESDIPTALIPVR